jgi:photosystem II stability/assembly factor-like uncharacterized protein
LDIQGKDEDIEFRSAPVGDAHFSNKGKNIWVVGGNLKRQSNDGGISWNDIQSPFFNSMSNPTIYGIYFLPNELNGWLLGQDIFLKTTDGGKTWDSVFMENSDDYFRIVSLQEKGHLLLVGRNSIYKSTDSGESWSVGPPLHFEPNFLTRIHFNKEGTGWLPARKTHHLMYTRDDGSTWEKIFLQSPSQTITTENLNGVFISRDGSKAWAVGDNGVRLISNDGGTSWKHYQDKINVGDFRDVDGSQDGSLIFAVSSQGGIVKLGPTYKINIMKKLETELNAIHLGLNGKKMWVAGENGTILFSNDGGEKWKEQRSDTEETLLDIFMDRDNRTGWITGKTGTVLYTENGGQKWVKLSTGGTTHINGVAFADDTASGWVIGDNGTILRSAPSLDTVKKIRTCIDLSALQDCIAKKKGLESLYIKVDADAKEIKEIDKIIIDLREDIRALESVTSTVKGGGKGGSTLADQKTAFNKEILFHVATNAIRMTIMVIIFFLAQVLLNSYRFHTRLSSFYHSRCDSLKLLAEVGGLEKMLDGLELREFFDSLSPANVDFGKTPPPPTAQGLDLAKELLSSVRK